MRKPIFKNGQSRLQQPLFSDLCSCLLMNTSEKVTRIWTLYCELACNHVANKSAVSIQILPQKSRHFAHEECLKRTGRVVPLESFPISVPQFQTVFFFPVLVPEVVGFSRVPVRECNRSASWHPEEHALFSLVRTRCPEVFVTQSCLVTNQ